MQNIIVGRYDQDPEAQGCIRPEDGAWQLVLDKEGIPHLYVRVKFEADTEGAPATGLLCLEDLLPDELSIRSVMEGEFGGRLSEEDERAAVAEHEARRASQPIPCPR